MKGLAGVHAGKLDVLDKAAIHNLAARLDGIDVLFNCAGFVHHGTVLDATDDEWRFAFDLNVRSMFWTIQAFLPGMLKRGGGSIINVASAASSHKGAPLRFVYGSTKAAVVGLTKSVAVDFVKQNIRCNAICPGTVESPSLNERIAVWNARGDRRAGRLPCQRRDQLYDRHDTRDRWRLEHLRRKP
jgi:2-keto-3-deoxy-L-fuconate dehydrogenase